MTNPNKLNDPNPYPTPAEIRYCGVFAVRQAAITLTGRPALEHLANAEPTHPATPDHVIIRGAHD